MFKNISKDILSYGVINGLKSLVPLLFIPILTKYLSPEDYGLLSIIEVSILFLMPFISLNIEGSIGVELYILDEKSHGKYITEALALSSMSFGVFFILFSLLSCILDSYISIPPFIILLLPVFCILRVMSGVIGVIYQMKHRILNFASFALTQTFLDFSFSLLFVVFYKFGFVGRLAGTYISYFIITCLGFFVISRMNLFDFKSKFKFYKRILSFGLPLIPHVIGGTVLAMSDRYFLLHFNGEESVGFYAVAYQMAAIMLLVGSSITTALSPIIFKILSDSDKNRFEKVLKIFLALSLFVFAVCIIIYLSKDLLFSIFVNEMFYEAKLFFPFLLLGFLFQSIYSFFAIYLFFDKKTKLLAKMTFIAAFCNVLLNYFFLLYYGAIGVAYATVLTWFLYSFIVVLVVSILIYNKIKNLF